MAWPARLLRLPVRQLVSGRLQCLSGGVCRQLSVVATTSRFSTGALSSVATPRHKWSITPHFTPHLSPLHTGSAQNAAENKPSDTQQQQQAEVTRGEGSSEVVEGERVPQTQHVARKVGVTSRGAKLNYSEQFGFLILEGRMANMVKMSKLMGLALAGSSLFLVPMMAQKIFEEHEDAPVVPVVVSLSIFGFVVIIIQPLLVHQLTKRYPTKMYYNYDSRLFTVAVTDIIAQDILWQFKAEDVFLTNKTFTTLRAEAMNLSSGKMKSLPILVDPSSFYDRDAYVYLMGYDKPMDVSLEMEETTAESDQQQVAEAEFEDEVRKLNLEFSKGLADGEKDAKEANVSADKVDNEIKQESVKKTGEKG